MRLTLHIIAAALIVILGGSLLSFTPARAAGSAPAPAAAPADTLPPLTVSMITCFPGPEVYELCGHTAIRIRSEQMDSVWNDGLFDFNQPYFVYRFVRGETNYLTGGYPFAWFLPEYEQRGSRVVEQQMNLSQPEARKLLAMLHRQETPPENVYRYNYVKKNCATRPLDRLDQISSRHIIYPDSIRYGTYRREMKAYHANYPWYQFGIDLVLGSGLDYDLSSREEMFVPVEMMNKLAMAHFEDGTPIVGKTTVLNEGRPGGATLPPTPWYLGPLFWGWILFAIILVIVIADIRRGRCTRVIYSLYWFIIGVAGFVVWFLVLFSSHEATSPNLLKWWLNPLMLIAAVTIWFRGARLFTDILAWIGGVPAFIVLMVWPFQPQCTNGAVFPLLGASILLSAAYAINYTKKSYKKEKPRYRPAKTSASRSRKSPAPRSRR